MYLYRKRLINNVIIWYDGVVEESDFMPKSGHGEILIYKWRKKSQKIKKYNL